MTENKNPFLKPYNTPHDTAPFHLIKIEHYEPALLEGMKEQNEEINWLFPLTIAGHLHAWLASTGSAAYKYPAMPY